MYVYIYICVLRHVCMSISISMRMKGTSFARPPTADPVKKGNKTTVSEALPMLYENFGIGVYLHKQS